MRITRESGNGSTPMILQHIQTFGKKISKRSSCSNVLVWLLTDFKPDDGGDHNTEDCAAFVPFIDDQ
ncbi:hypothetical protein DPMN_141008 [Dreissena polymorpha]|uniref:Uncharacterized protein n=1 Tax=Dreissena polymorpha TaxID=45954 RepID=A0A9D4G8U1_DREPO|nr:hypothetical protein DPMN_141008 [Dreissena polymorpha]